MTKSIKNGKVVYNFLDVENFNIKVSVPNKQMIRFDFPNDCYFITPKTAKDLIKVLQEFAETGELK
jgi:hypothetical protein